jgi:hypothetical protein
MYPKIDFNFEPVGDFPPQAMEARFEAGDRYPQEITFLLYRPGNSFRTLILATLFVKKPYEKLNVNMFKCEWDTGDKVFYDIEAKFRYAPDRFYLDRKHWKERNGYFWRGIRYAVLAKESFGRPDFTQIFTDKNPGDKFNVKFTLRYSFDDEPERTEVLEFHVTALKGKWVNTNWPK